MKANKIVDFFKTLGLEIDKEIIKAVKNVGIIKIILSVFGFFLLRYLVISFGSEESVFTFYCIIIISVLLFLVWYASELKEVSKIRFLIDYGGQILMTLVSFVIIVALLYGIINLGIDAFNWIIDFFK
tara:strand:- start:2060 stop:2443 length:384 start_codon:yes stop_codon:yes gene_type:complete